MSKETSPNPNPTETTPTATPDATAPANDSTKTNPAETQPATETPAGFTQADIDAAVAKAIKEANKKAEDAAANAKLTEDERKNKLISELQNTINMGNAQTQVLKALEKENAKIPLLLFNVKKGELKFDDSGKLTNLDEIIQDLKSEYKDQFGIEKPNTPIDAGAGTTVDGKPLTKEMLAKMSPAEINTLDWKLVQQVLADK